MRRRFPPSSDVLELDPHQTDLMLAVINQDIDLVKALLDSGADIEARDRQGKNVLYHAFPEIFSDKSKEIFKLLASKGINVNASLDADGCSALVTAVVANEPGVIECLIEHDVDVNEAAMSKFCGSLRSVAPSQQSLSMDSTPTSQFFFSKGCGHSITPLLCAVMFQHHQVAHLLIKAKAAGDCLSYGSFWRAVGHSVCSNCEVQITPLHMAAYLGDLYMTHVLMNDTFISNRVDININCCLSYNDISPLWFALLQGHESIVKLFLTVGKPLAPPCHFGTGLQVCLQEGHLAVAHMILRAGYDLEEDMEWIQSGRFPTEDEEMKTKILALAEQPRPLLEWCCCALREKFGIHLNDYLQKVGAPNKVGDILNFNDLSKASWKIQDLQIQHMRDKLISHGDEAPE